MGDKDRTKNLPQSPFEERESRLNDFLQGKITATTLLEETSEDDSGLKDAVLALARRNVKQGKA